MENSTLSWTTKSKTLCTNTRKKDQLFRLTAYCCQPIARFLFLEYRKFLFCVYLLFRCHQRAARLVSRTSAQSICANSLVPNTEGLDESLSSQNVLKHSFLGRECRLEFCVWKERFNSKQLIFDSNDATRDDKLLWSRLVCLENFDQFVSKCLSVNFCSARCGRDKREHFISKQS